MLNLKQNFLNFSVPKDTTTHIHNPIDQTILSIHFVHSFHNFHYYNKSILIIILTLESIDYLVIRRCIFYKFLEITIQCLIIIIITIFIVCIGTNLFKRFQIMIVDWTFKNLKNMFQ